jgi:hypothetical protein
MYRRLSSLRISLASKSSVVKDEPNLLFASSKTNALISAAVTSVCNEEKEFKEMSRDDVELAFVIEGADKELESEVNRAFPEAIVSPADNFLGGLELAVIIPLLAPLRKVLEEVLRFVNQWHERYKDSSITFDGKKIALKGYRPGDAIKIMNELGIENDEIGG